MKTNYITPATDIISLEVENMLALSPNPETPGSSVNPGQYVDPDGFDSRTYNSGFDGGQWDDME